MKNLILILVIALSAFTFNNVFADNCIIEEGQFNIYFPGQVYTFCSEQGQCEDCYYWEVEGAEITSQNVNGSCIDVLITDECFDIWVTFFANGDCNRCPLRICPETVPPVECCTPKVIGVHDCLTECRGWLQIYPDDCEKFDGLNSIELHWVPATAEPTEDMEFEWVDGTLNPTTSHITTVTPTLTNDVYFQVDFCSNACNDDIIEIHLYYQFEEEQCNYMEIYQFDSHCGCEETEGRINNPTVFPNPIQNKININTTFSNIERDVNISISDLNSGRLVTSKNYNEIEAGQFNDSFEIPSTIKNGLYILSITSKNELLHTSVIQQSN